MKGIFPCVYRRCWTGVAIFPRIIIMSAKSSLLLTSSRTLSTVPTAALPWADHLESELPQDPRKVTDALSDY